jgi:ATP-binding cassette subfamily B protein
MKSASIRAAVLSALFLPIVTSLGSLAAAYALWKGGYDVFLGTMTFGTLTVFMSYSTQIFEPISSIARIFADLQSSQAAAERVITMIETEPEISDTPEVVEKYGDSFHRKRKTGRRTRATSILKRVLPVHRRRKGADEFQPCTRRRTNHRAGRRDGQRQIHDRHLICRFTSRRGRI